MRPQDLGIPVPPLGMGRIVITSRKVVAPSGVDVRPGGLDIDGCECHVRIVDGITGEAWLAPIPPRAARDLLLALDKYTPKPTQVTVGKV